ncbi:MAG: hypothetical protein QNJ38_24660 [Prochloraceae cyanobacterium]|nr:hypothetical protein [Prochloraceae cyanobacterium]
MSHSKGLANLVTGRILKNYSSRNSCRDLNRYQEWVVSLIEQNRSSEIIGYKDWLNRYVNQN